MCICMFSYVYVYNCVYVQACGICTGTYVYVYGVCAHMHMCMYMCVWCVCVYVWCVCCVCMYRCACIILVYVWCVNECFEWMNEWIHSILTLLSRSESWEVTYWSYSRTWTTQSWSMSSGCWILFLGWGGGILGSQKTLSSLSTIILLLVPEGKGRLSLAPVATAQQLGFSGWIVGSYTLSWTSP